MSRPKVVCLVGSTRFKTQFEAVARAATLAGEIVLTCHVFSHHDGTRLSAADVALLDRVHLAKIDMADEVYVINPGGYIGEGGRREIAYAEAAGKPVGYLCTDQQQALGQALKEGRG